MQKPTILTLAVFVLFTATVLYAGGGGEAASTTSKINYKNPSIIDRISGPKWIPPANFAKVVEGTKSLSVLNAGSMKFDPATDMNNKYFTEVTGIEIKSVDVSLIYEKSIAALGAGSSALDVIYADHIMLWDFVYPGWLAPIDELWDQESLDYYSPAVIQPIKVKDHYWGVPKYAQVYAFHYRPDLLSAAGLSGPPKTWEDIMAYAKKLTKGTDQYGYVFPMQNQRTAATMFHILIMQQEGHTVNPSTGKVQFDTPEALAAMEFYTNMVKNGYAPEGVTSYEGSNAADLLYAGKAAMMIGKAYMWSEATGKDGQLKKGVTYDQVQIPTPPGVSKSYTYMDADYMAVSKFSKNLEASKLYCDFIRSFQCAKLELITEGNGSVIPAVYEDPEVKQKNPYFEVAIAATKSARTEIFYQEMQIAKMIQNAMVASVTGKMTPKEAVQDLQKRVDQLLGQ